MGKVAEPSQREKALADRATVVRPAPAKVVTRLQLTPEEGFLFSRVDRPTSIADVLRSSGLPEDRALQHLLNLVTKGALLLPGDADAAAPAPARGGAPSAWGDFVFSPAELNEDVELDLERRKQILFLFHSLDELSHFRLLDVPPTATPAEVRRAYLEKSKLFHPDAFFRKRLGGYKGRIEAIFHRLKLAYDTLMDEDSRRRYERDRRGRFTPEEESALIQREIDFIEEEQRQRVRRERLMRSKGFARLTKSRELMAEGDEALAKGDLLAATSAYQLASELDPRFEDARTKLVEARRVAHARRADLALEEAARVEQEGNAERAAELLRGAAELDANNARVHAALARVLLAAGADPREARTHAQRAVDLGDRSAKARLVLGEAFLRCGLKKNARRELELAAEGGEAAAAKALLRQC